MLFVWTVYALQIPYVRVRFFYCFSVQKLIIKGNSKFQNYELFINPEI